MVNNKMITYSVVIPCYNSEEYISECLDSIIYSESEHSVEIIVVDDGSIDSTSEIVSDYMTKIECGNAISYYYKDNGGLSSARNFGIEKAVGEFIIFLDSDDVLHVDFFGVISKYRDYDIVSFDFSRFSNIRTLDYSQSTHLYNTVKENYSLSDVFLAGNWYAPMRVYRKDIFTKKRFKEDIYYEDLELISKIYLSSPIFIHLNKPLYGYRITEGSITNSVNEKHIKDLKLIMSDLENGEFHDIRHFNLSYLINSKEMFLGKPITKFQRRISLRYYFSLNRYKKIFFISPLLLKLYYMAKSLWNCVKN
ncbi:glycosyltransferase family 2 protein [Vibrio comitans]|uniref:Glycosyltransferase 2-like domain-containing protein n=1 Tax=Vibrio comitans NBRC 102076 TaxID=1219078 RepID=A0A4Y3IR28_9VIBR|nr:glycosyltransferase family 2 protein [Vibrio comitans]GEA61999.1 hypothetical protein VCO01S_31920 [Vibrio comitans NBRC 102076]